MTSHEIYFTRIDIDMPIEWEKKMYVVPSMIVRIIHFGREHANAAHRHAGIITFPTRKSVSFECECN